jgi:hypothetical protein
MNDDRFLEVGRREPRAEFARGLRERLRSVEDAPAPRWRPALHVTVGVAVIAAAFLFPQVRASAQAMLDLFRVRQFTAVAFDESRMEKLRQLQESQTSMLIFDSKEVLKDPGPDRTFESVDAAGAAAGLVLKKPAIVPRGMTLKTVKMEGEGELRFTIRSAKLRPLLDALDLRDVEIPTGFDGQPITVRKPAVVIQAFEKDRLRAALVQARTPEVSLPPGADLEKLGEVGLRALGLDAGEARSLARSIDWHSTLLVPVPATAANFRKLTVHGQQALLIETRRTETEGSRSILMWSEDDRVYGVLGNLGETELVQMAESVQ